MAGPFAPEPFSNEEPGPPDAPPQPGLPRTIGIFHVVFAGFLFLCGLGCLRQFGPAFDQFQTARIDPEIAQQMYEQVRNDLVADLLKREQAAPDAAEKARLKTEREELVARQVKIADQLDLKAINLELRWFSWYLWADVISGPVLNLLMLAAGIGLIQLREWARKLALWVAGLKIVRLVALTLMLTVFVLPHMSRALETMLASDLGKAVIAKAMADQARQGNVAPMPQLDARTIVPVMTGAGTVWAVFSLGLCLIYPMLTLVVLTRPGARCACFAAEVAEKSEDEDDRASW